MEFRWVVDDFDSVLQVLVTKHEIRKIDGQTVRVIREVWETVPSVDIYDLPQAEQDAIKDARARFEGIAEDHEKNKIPKNELYGQVPIVEFTENDVYRFGQNVGAEPVASSFESSVGDDARGPVQEGQAQRQVSKDPPQSGFGIRQEDEEP